MTETDSTGKQIQWGDVIEFIHRGHAIRMTALSKDGELILNDVSSGTMLPLSSGRRGKIIGNISNDQI